MNSRRFDAIVRHGALYDGSGEPPRGADVGIAGDRIEAVGSLANASAALEIDAEGLAVAPGFINILSWAAEPLIHDGRGQSGIRQGVTLEVVGEGFSMGPLSPAMKRAMQTDQTDIRYEVEWTTLGEFLAWIEKRGISPNIASFFGTGSLRAHEVEYANRPAAPAEMERMRALARQAMREGAMGASSALIYAPGCFASTEELIALACEAAEFGGMYISHIRDEGAGLLDSIEEFMTIARESSARSEIYHLKASGPSNWRLLDPAIERIERARAKGMPVGADVYPYHASGTGMTSLFPLWALEGGFAETVKRFGDPEMRRTIRRQILGDDPQFACLLRHAEGAERVMPVGFKSQALKPLAGRTLDSIARERGTDALDAAMDLIVEDGSRIESVFFTMSEENVRKKVALPWTSICSDAGSMAPEGVFLKRMVHPRTYGAFARVLGKYVREERALSLELAVRKMSGLPAETLGLKDRGRVAEGCFADLAVFDPMAIADRATFAQPHRYSVGMRHVFVNGVQVLADGEHTGARPGKAVRGPGYKA